MKALVTGATGFVGSHLVEALLERGYEVSCLVRESSPLRWIDWSRVNLMKGDVLDEASLAKAVEGVDYVFHLASATKGTDAKRFDSINCEGTSRLLNAVARTNPKVKRVVHVSTLWAAGPGEDHRPLTEDSPCRPLSAYSKSKLAGERVAREYMGQLNITIVRPCSVYGPRDTNWLGFFRMIKKGLSIQLGSKERHQNLIHVRDLARGIILAAESEQARGETYFLASPKTYSWGELCRTASNVLNNKILQIRIPETILFVTAVVIETLNNLVGTPRYMERAKMTEMVHPYWVCDTSKAEKHLGFHCNVVLEEGFKETLRWYQENHLI